MKDRLLRLIEEFRAPESEAKNHPFLPDIVRSLEKLADSLDSSKEHRSRLAGGIGRLALEDYAFCQGALGGELFSLLDEVSGT